MAEAAKAFAPLTRIETRAIVTTTRRARFRPECETLGRGVAPAVRSGPCSCAMTTSVRFPTPIGECTLHWNDAGLTHFAFPAHPRFPAQSSGCGAARESSAPSSALRPPSSVVCPPSSVLCPPSSVVRPRPSAARPPAIAAVIGRVQRHLAGDLQDFADIAYDWTSVTDFQRRVLRALLKIRPGRTATYGELARQIGAKPGAARAIGGAVGANPWPLLVPCHRILGADGRLTGYSAPGGVATKAALLSLEGVGVVV